MFQLTAARRRLDKHNAEDVDSDMVSTHSRPKAAGAGGRRCFLLRWVFQLTAARRRLGQTLADNSTRNTFQLTAARRRLVVPALYAKNPEIVSTHSRPKAAGAQSVGGAMDKIVSTHSRPKAAGLCIRVQLQPRQRFNSQPPEGGWKPIKS